MSTVAPLEPQASDCSATRARPPSLLEEARSRSLYLRTYAANGRVPMIDASAAVHPTAVLIGDVRIGPDCWIGPNATLRADQGRIEIGARTSIQDNCVLHTGPDGLLSIDEEGQIGHGAMLHGCTIERNVLIGMGAIVLDDAVVEHDVVVAAATLVPGKARVPTGMLFVGSPGKVVRPLTPADIASKRECTEHYVALARAGSGMSWAPAHIVASNG
ncbi:MAG TPA: gamma carbonic anhydrase family protein [Burkholderiaceae bacterium]|jgi:phenylacetic acid degradation protein|nr:gamma carbonic anhydrase family protein [Burkholderiaceae bacterium]